MTVSSPVPYSGPSDNDPLTDAELALLQAIPRAAESTPNATLFRLPLGPDPSMGWIDVTCAETRSIVAHLGDRWKSKLSCLLSKTGQPDQESIGPGTIICIVFKPDVHGIFHVLAFWALGCTIQFVSMSDPIGAVDQLNESGCKVVLCSGFDDDWVEARKEHFNGLLVQVPEGEQAHELAKLEKEGQVSAPPWPTPRRPTPASIFQSSGTTGRPKLLRLSLHYYTITAPAGCRTFLESTHLDRTSKTPYTHPRLVAMPFYWAKASHNILSHLAAAAPMAFAYIPDIYNFPPSQLIDWAIALDAGAVACSTGTVRLIPKATYQVHAEFLRSLYSFSFTGSTMSGALSQVFEELKIHVTNQYGSSELAFMMQSSKPPYTELRPCRGAPPPLFHPISDYGPDGSRYVELWFAPTTSPVLAHHLAHCGVLVKLEPFPGDGPHKGEPAFNLGDIFQELTTRGESESESEIVHVHVGRHTDEVRLGMGGFGSVDGALYEATLSSEIDARISHSGNPSWAIDGVQLFGNNMSRTALVIQLRLDQDIIGSSGMDSLDELTVRELYKSVEKTNNLPGLTECTRVHTGKRALIVSSDGTPLHGSGMERLAGSSVPLSMTHKRSLKRWENVCKFKPWLDGLDFSE